jgi:NAD(P)-dependent dehydrogenase (short-subunit alcohol dehydrogenase family)
MRTAVVTGAGRGLGRELALALAARGLAVNVTDVDERAAQAAAEEIGGGAWASALDVRDAEACRTIASAAAARGELAAWVNNAGILATGLTWEQDDELRRTMMDVNALGTFNGTLAALGPMRAAGRGHVINIISLAGLVAAPGEALYAASKHAAIAFTLGTLADLRRSGERRIQLSAVCPDGIWTPMLHDKLDDPHAAGSFSGSLQRPEVVARRAVALLDRPRAVIAIPRWRGALLRLFDASPGLANRLVGVAMADARRRQRAWKRRIERGDAP